MRYATHSHHTPFHLSSKLKEQVNSSLPTEVAERLLILPYNHRPSRRRDRVLRSLVHAPSLQTSYAVRLVVVALVNWCKITSRYTFHLYRNTRGSMLWWEPSGLKLVKRALLERSAGNVCRRMLKDTWSQNVEMPSERTWRVLRARYGAGPQALLASKSPIPWKFRFLPQRSFRRCEFGMAKV